MKPLGIDPQHCLIDGEWVSPANGEYLQLVNPSDGTHLCEIARGSAEDIARAVSAARKAYDTEWGATTALQRSRYLARLKDLILQNTDELARLESIDVGKPLTQARADVIALARYMEFYAGAADKLHGQTIPYLDGYTVYTLREPHGVTGHIIPWNYPMQIIGRSIGASLAAGNACVLKPAEEACLTALAFAELARQAELPAGTLNVVPGLGAEAGAALTRSKGVDHISFTGSVNVGKEIQRNAAENIVPVTLELGGKSPQVVFDDADVDAAIPFLVNAGIQNAGQTCSASSRILVHKSRYDEVTEKMAARYSSLVAGPALKDLDLGPLVSQRQKQIVEDYLKQGADLQTVAVGSIHPEAPEGGAYTAPVLFAGTQSDHILAQQEIFGPVQMLLPFHDEDEAVTLANATDFGLVASCWTRDGARQMRMAKKLRSGQVFINNYGAGGGVELPFGGSGLSGHGREKGFEALYGFTTLKTVAALHG